MRKYCGRWEYKLRNHGYKCTATREIVLEILHSTNDHLSPEDIYLKAHENYPNIGLTTVYRTLDMLSKLGMVQKFDFGDGRSRYELSEDLGHKKHHHHLICIKCGRILDYSEFIEEELLLLKKIEKKVGIKYKFKINDHILQFNGICNLCIS